MAAVSGVFFIKGELEALVLASIAGACLSVPYLVPYSLLPDVIDQDELHTGKRREGSCCVRWSGLACCVQCARCSQRVPNDP